MSINLANRCAPFAALHAAGRLRPGSAYHMGRHVLGGAQARRDVRRQIRKSIAAEDRRAALPLPAPVGGRD